MAFSALTLAQIAAKEATKQELFTKIKDNFDNHESRITSLESSSGNFQPIVWRVVGASYSISGTLPLMYFRAHFTFNITGSTLWVIDDGYFGTVEVDVLKSTNSGASFTSIYTTRPQVPRGSGAFQEDAGVLNGVPSLNAGDYLKLDLLDNQLGNKEFYLILTIGT